MRNESTRLRITAIPEFTVQARGLFAEAISRHRLDLVALDDANVALVGPAHAVIVGGDRDGVLVFYVERRPDGQVHAYNIGNWVDGRFAPEDRAAYGAPVTAEEHVLAALRVVAPGLTRRCQEVLSGDRGWLGALQRRDPDSWRPLNFVPFRQVLAARLRAPAEQVRR